MLLPCFFSSEVRNLSIILCRILTKSENCALHSAAYGEINYSSQANLSCSLWKLGRKKRGNSILWMQLCTLNYGRPEILSFSYQLLIFLGNKSTLMASNVDLNAKSSQILIFRMSLSPFSLFKFIDICKYG